MTFQNFRISASILLITIMFSLNAIATNDNGQVTETEVCFAVNVNGAASTVRGTLFATRQYEWNKRAMVLLHGAASDRSAWTGLAPLTPNIPQSLARSGYGVFAIDRIGYGESSYEGPGGGFGLLVDTQVKATREIVTQIQDGSFSVTEGSCEDGTPSGQTADTVFLAGHSSGALIAQAFATRYDDLAGIIVLAWSGFDPSGEAVSSLVDNHILPQVFIEGKDYVTWVPYVDGYSMECESGFFNARGASPVVIETVCTEGFLGTTPTGEFFDLGIVIGEVAANVGNAGDTAVLFVMGRKDAYMPGPAGGPSGEEVDIQTPEIAHWQANCNCEVSVVEARHSGHMIQAHRDMFFASARMANWLDQH